MLFNIYIFFWCMISVGLKEWFAKVPTTLHIGVNLPIHAEPLAKHVAQQQETSLESSSQSSYLHPR